MVDGGFEPWSDQTKDYEIGICCFPAEHTALRRKSKELEQHVYRWTVVSVS